MIKNLPYDTQMSCTKLLWRVRGKVYEISDGPGPDNPSAEMGDGGRCLVRSPPAPLSPVDSSGCESIVHRNTADNWRLRTPSGGGGELLSWFDPTSQDQFRHINPRQVPFPLCTSGLVMGVIFWERSTGKHSSRLVGLGVTVCTIGRTHDRGYRMFFFRVC